MTKGRLSIREEQILRNITSEKFTTKEVGARGSELIRLENRGLVKRCGMTGPRNRTTVWQKVT